MKQCSPLFKNYIFHWDRSKDLQGLSQNAIFIPFEQVFWFFNLSNAQKLHLETGCKTCRAQNVTFILFEQFSHETMLAKCTKTTSFTETVIAKLPFETNPVNLMTCLSERCSFLTFGEHCFMRSNDYWHEKIVQMEWKLHFEPCKSYNLFQDVVFVHLTN